MNGAELRALRESRGLSRAELARAWGVSPRMIYKLEHGGALPRNYANPARQLATRSRFVVPTRRRAKSGKLAKVRTKTGSSTPPRTRGRGGVSFDRAGTQRAVVFVPDGAGHARGVSKIRRELTEAGHARRTATVTAYSDPTLRNPMGSVAAQVGPRSRPPSVSGLLDLLDDRTRYAGLHDKPGIFVVITY